MLVQSFSVELWVWFGVLQPAALMYLNSACPETPRRLALGLAFAVVEKLYSYCGVLCLVHFKKAQISLPFIFPTGGIERWH